MQDGCTSARPSLPPSVRSRPQCAQTAGTTLQAAKPMDLTGLNSKAQPSLNEDPARMQHHAASLMFRGLRNEADSDGDSNRARSAIYPGCIVDSGTLPAPEEVKPLPGSATGGGARGGGQKRRCIHDLASVWTDDHPRQSRRRSGAADMWLLMMTSRPRVVSSSTHLSNTSKAVRPARSGSPATSLGSGGRGKLPLEKGQRNRVNSNEFDYQLESPIDQRHIPDTSTLPS